MSYIKIGSRAYRNALISMLLGSLVTFATLYCPQGLISVFSEQYHVSPSTASFTISFTTAALAISMVLIALFSNAYGRKWIMSGSLLITSLLTILSSFGHDFHFLLLMRLLAGISLAGFPATAMAYLSEEFSPASIGVIMGVYVAGNGVGAFVGRVIIGGLTDLFSWQIALMSLGIVSLVCSLCFWMLLPESQNFQPGTVSFAQLRDNIKTGLNNKNLLYLYGIGFLLMGIYVVLFNYIGYPLRKKPYNLSQTALGFLFVVNLVGSWGSVYFGKLADRYPRPYVIAGAILLLLTGATLTLHNWLLPKIIGLVIFAFGFFAGHTIACGWVGIVAPKGAKSQASSLYLLFYYSGSSFIGWAGGFFWSFFGWIGVIGLIYFLLGFTALLAFKTADSGGFVNKQ
jgi:MFS transporter, YNFM family, putative membrane transport protein